MKMLKNTPSTFIITFVVYRFLSVQVFSALPETMTPTDQHKHESSLDEVCWALCSNNYLERDNPVFPDDCVFKLFRVFCMLGDMVENEETGRIEVRGNKRRRTRVRCPSLVINGRALSDANWLSAPSETTGLGLDQYGRRGGRERPTHSGVDGNGD